MVGSDSWAAIATLAGSVTSFTDTAVVAGTSYRYRAIFALSAGQPVIVTSAETGPEPTDADSDQLTGGEELAIGTNPLVFSTDSDTLGDGFERSNGLNPLSADENGNGVADQYDDFDGDGVSTWQEAAYGTSTSRAD